MKRFLLILLCNVMWAVGQAQTLTLVSPAGMEEPYEVTGGTAVTLQWKSTAAPNTLFSYSAQPSLDDPYTLDTRWKQSTNFSDNGDGTYNFTVTITDPVYIWGGNKFDFTGMWSFSNVIKIDIASGVKITAADGFLCNASSDKELLTTTGTYLSYQWYFNDEAITGATTATYQATQSGKYKVQVPLAGKSVFSNTQHIQVAGINFAGSLTTNKLTLKALDGLSSYQWLSGVSAATLSPIASANASSTVVTLNGSHVYYAVKAVQAGCVVQSEARPASTTLLKKPVITVDAPPPNAFGKICEGTFITLAVPDQYASYVWYKAGVLYADGISSLQLSSESGYYSAGITTVEWPEIILTSDEAEISYFVVRPPDLSINNTGYYCPGESATITLLDEGYTYTWYNHADYNFTDADKVTVTDAEYTFSVSDNTYVSVVASYSGCEASASVFVKSFTNASLYPELSDYSKTYLCAGSTVDAFVASYVASDYETFQWYKLSGIAYKVISGQTASTYTITAPGTYLVKAISKGCPSVEITSEPTIIQDNAERILYIDSDQAGICMGGQATLSVSSDWTNIQWLEKKIVFGATAGYDETYVPISGAGTGNSLVVNKFTGYEVKARHISCSTGLKITSVPFEVRPALNPDIIPSPDHPVSRWRHAPYDSMASYIYCDQDLSTLMLPEGYSSYAWYSAPYNGDNNYVVGNAIASASGNTLAIKAFGATWYTAMVTADGCTGLSDPILIDTYVHSTPAIASYDNNELCASGDSTLLNNAFNGNWVKYEWYKDGDLVPDSDNDSIYVKEPGGYWLVGFPEECPTIGYSSGLPVDIHMYPKATIVENDTILYALPFQGYYTFQWYRDDEPLDPEEYPWILHKNKMKTGSYTVQVINPKACTSVSDPFHWVITGVESGMKNEFMVYPNPTHGKYSISGLESGTIISIRIYALHCTIVQQNIDFKNMQFDLSAQPPGIYMIEAMLADGTRKKAKIIRY